ncbi:glycosyltransferase BC10-like [Magnolia sinica]|uniref:glycosyltransferase BC10-like n=1 Tax=Magnolia sinica TaxID=86752 RepID=UPI0026582414|nr:glycosyltransferase BC10-like [Magnolia sinica]
MDRRGITQTATALHRFLKATIQLLVCTRKCTPLTRGNEEDMGEIRAFDQQRYPSHTRAYHVPQNLGVSACHEAPLKRIPCRREKHVRHPKNADFFSLVTAFHKRFPSFPIRPGSRLFISLTTVLFIFALFRLHSLSKLPSSAPARNAAASVLSRPSNPFVGTPKIAFLFLARSNLPLDFLWQGFFQNAEEGSFSVYIHSKPGFVFDRSTTRCAFFYGRQLSKSFQVAWGESSMIEAEQLLFRAALQDPANQRFVLVSDSCIPLYNFSYVYNYIMSSSKSFVDCFLDTKEGLYNPKMSLTIPKGKWRKGSQWITLVRKHAEVIMADDIVIPVFKRYCKREVIQMEQDCIPDEHYMQTLLAMSELEDGLERRSLTFALWNQSASETERQSWHPVTFKHDDASPERIKEIKGINHVYYETEHRTEWCRSNATSMPCFLFARKFSRGAAMRLLREGVVGPFDASVLLA